MSRSSARPALPTSRILLSSGAFLAASTLLAGCGSSGGMQVKGNSQIATVTTSTGILFSDPQSGSGSPLQGLNGALTAQASVLTATFHSSGCVLPSADLTFTGNKDANGNITLSSTNLPQNTAVITGQFSTDYPNLFLGGLTISGSGPCAYTAGIAARGTEYAPLTGTFTGALTSAASTLTLTQGAANADGYFSETGTLTFTAGSCTTSYNLSGLLAGPNLSATLTATSGTATATLTSTTQDVSPALIDLALTIPGSGCDAGSYTGYPTAN